MDFGQRLEWTLDKARISQRQLARVTDMPNQTINEIVKGKRVHITIQTLVRIANALGCSTDWLLGRSSVGPTPKRVRDSLAAAGASLMEDADVPMRDPANINSGRKSRRGRTLKSVLLGPNGVQTDHVPKA